MNQKFVIITLIVAGLVVGGVWYYTKSDAPGSGTDKLVSEQVKDQDIQVFSFGGTVTKLEEGKFVFKTGSVKDTAEGRKYVEEEKTVLLTEVTKYFLKNLNNKGTLSDLKVGSNVTVYTKQNPFENSEITALEILINY